MGPVTIGHPLVAATPCKRRARGSADLSTSELIDMLFAIGLYCNILYYIVYCNIIVYCHIPVPGGMYLLIFIDFY